MNDFTLGHVGFAPDYQSERWRNAPRKIVQVPAPLKGKRVLKRKRKPRSSP